MQTYPKSNTTTINILQHTITPIIDSINSPKSTTKHLRLNLELYKQMCNKLVKRYNDNNFKGSRYDLNTVSMPENATYQERENTYIWVIAISLYNNRLLLVTNITQKDNVHNKKIRKNN